MKENLNTKRGGILFGQSFGNFVHLCEHILGFQNYSNPVYATTTQP